MVLRWMGISRRNLHQHAAVQLLLTNSLMTHRQYPGQSWQTQSAGPWWSLPEPDGKDVVFRHVFHPHGGGSCCWCQKHDISGLKQAGVLPSLRYRFSRELGVVTKDVLDIHYRDKGQVTGTEGSATRPRSIFCCSSRSLGRGLALYGDLHVGILVNEGFKIGEAEYICTVCCSHRSAKWPISNS